jgi:hypothetical protein
MRAARRFCSFVLCAVAGEVKIIYLKKSECRETRIDDCQSAGLLCAAQNVFFLVFAKQFYGFIGALLHVYLSAVFARTAAARTRVPP